MILYLVRHAHAVSEERDSARPLSSRGIECSRRIAEFFRQNGAFVPAQVWHSPLSRARETAQLLITELGLDCGMVETPDLLPEDDPVETAARLTSFMRTEPLAIVGHEPHLSSLATLLVRGRPYPPAFVMKKGAVLALERTADLHSKTKDPRWVVQWQLTPALLPLRSPAIGCDPGTDQWETSDEG